MTFAARTTMLAAGAAAVVVAGCTGSESTGDANLVAGKQLFVQRCGSCHVLARADTKGTVGPNLDAAFAQARAQGFGESAIRGMVRQQIALVRRGSKMPRDLVTGNEARDVAAYVAQSVAKPGKDTGLLATAVRSATSAAPAVARNGTLRIDADPNGQLAFVTKAARAPAGRLTVVMTNRSGVPHNIAIRGVGAGKVVRNGVSRFTATLRPGTYTYLCEVTGHAEAGMTGKLTVR